MSRGAPKRRLTIPFYNVSGSSGGTAAIGAAATQAVMGPDYAVIGLSARFKPPSSCNLKVYYDDPSGCNMFWKDGDLASSSYMAWHPDDLHAASGTHAVWFAWTPAATGGSAWWNWQLQVV